MKNNTPKKRKLVFGFGINDANYIINQNVNGKRSICHFYATWANMLRRCYSDKCHQKWPTYAQCTVSNEWLTFSKFKSWMVEQDWKGNAIDKDILVQGNKVYSSLTCIFVNESINNLLNNIPAKRGIYPLGVRLHRTSGKYEAQCKHFGNFKHLGTYHTPEEAHEAYKTFKYKHIAEIANQQSEPLRTALLNYVIEG
jgi:hypothetical protein